jgi:hypothetical protein
LSQGGSVVHSVTRTGHRQCALPRRATHARVPGVPRAGNKDSSYCIGVSSTRKIVDNPYLGLYGEELRLLNHKPES